MDNAIHYVRERGTDIERARMDSILWKKPAPKKVYKELAAMQHSDGGFSHWVPGTSTNCDTAFVLQWFDDLELHDTPAANAACRYLLDRQLPDGGWDEAEAITAFDPPEWLVPGRIETRVWLTGFVSHVLIRFGHADASESRCPSYFLLAHCNEQGRMTGFDRATWLALPMLAFFPGRESESFKKALTVIAELHSPDREAGHLGWLLCCLSDAGLSADHPLVSRRLDDLENLQQPDGRWDPEEGEGERHIVNSTVASLRALKAYGRI